MATTEPAAKRQRTWQPVKASAAAMRFVNPIRALVDRMKITPNPKLTLIRLSIGDPTVFGNYQPAQSTVNAVVAAVTSGRKNGYAPSHGYDESRQAIAEYYTHDKSPITKDDVVIASGCSGALDLAIGAIADEGTNILVPAPGFSLYKTLASAKGIETRSYRCLPDQDWRVDLEHMASLINDETRAIVVTNPSNPCGSNFSEEHVAEIVAVAAKYKVPIIADEIYSDMVFSGAKFTSVSAIESDVPILACGGLAKRWLVPGWRLGWVLVRDKNGVLSKEIKQALINLSQLVLGASTPIQAALPTILADTPHSFYADVMTKLRASATLLFDGISKIPGLTAVMPEAAMYMMVGVDIDKFKDINDDREFTEKLVAEQSVFCLPASVFECPNYFRIVTTVKVDIIKEALDRIAVFCRDHHV